MKNITTACVAVAFVLLAGCRSATTPAPTPNSPGPTNFKYGRGDGQTMASAVEIRTRSETDGGNMIRNWIRQRYPGYVIHQQELIEQRDKAFNMITIIGPNNTPQNVYFDISTYYRRIGNENFPKPLG
ncbi:MAG TPA: hypothetical protein VFS58_03120 [Steroidobacteraceae bacterium]|nr:hypothetical protein [Steroidobacteraceae bacterium]